VGHAAQSEGILRCRRHHPACTALALALVLSSAYGDTLYCHADLLLECGSARCWGRCKFMAMLEIVCQMPVATRI
jgi:hypothetical protein